MQEAPRGRKRATLLLAFGGYVNNGILIVQGLVLVPMYLHFIGAHMYGLWMASGGVLGLLGVMNFGIGNMLVQRVANAYGQQDLQKAASYFFNGMLVYLAIVLVFAITGLLASTFLPALLKVSEETTGQLQGCFRLAVVAAALGIVNECIRSFAQALLRPVFSMFSIAVSRVSGIAVTAMLLLQGAGLWAIPAGALLAESLILLSGLAQAVVLLRGMQARIALDRRILKEYLQVGSSLFLATLGSALSRESDPLLITLMLRPELTTAYMLTRRAADIVAQVLAVFYGATHSSFSHLVGQGDETKTSRVASSLLVMAFTSGLIGFATYSVMNHSFVKLWVGEGFALGQELALAIAIAFFVNSLRNVAWQMLNGFGEYRFTSRVILLEGIGKTFLAVGLLHYLGVIGMPFALLVGSGISLIVIFTKLRQQVNFLIAKPVLVRAIAAAVVAFTLAGVYAGTPDPASWAGFVLATGGAVSGALLLCALFNWRTFKTLVKEHL